MSTGAMTESSAASAAPKTLKQHLTSEAMQRQIAMVVPKHVTAERMVRVALTALTRNPKLANCTEASFFKCLLDCAQWGIEPDGRRAHLIPFDVKKKQPNGKWEVDHTDCTLIIDYKGFAELAYRSGLVRKIHAMEVRHGDIFEYDCGEVKKHIPHFLRRDAGKPKDAGEIYAYYCRVHMEGDVIKSEVMSVEEVNSIRDKSQGWTSFKNGYAKTSPWNDYPVEMGKKTVFKRCSKWLPLTAEFRAVIERDDEDYVPRVETQHSIDSLGSLIANDDRLPAIEGSIAEEEGDAPGGDDLPDFDAAKQDVENAADPMKCKEAYDKWLAYLKEDGDKADLSAIYEAKLKTYPTKKKGAGQQGLPLEA